MRVLWPSGVLSLLLLSHPVLGAGSLWTALPLVTGAQKKAGVEGGEGCQKLQALAVGPDGKFLLAASNVGGIYRSLDGGLHWEPSNAGYKARGASAFAIDPHDPSHVLAQGANAGAQPWNGLWVSNDQGSSWRLVQGMPLKSNGDYRENLAFDPSQVLVSRGVTQCQRAYWLAPGEGGGGLWRCEDGGLQWKKLRPELSDGIVKVDPKGILLLALAAGEKAGLYRSSDHGASFTRTVTGKVLGLDLVGTLENSVFIAKQDGIWVSRDSGNSFTRPKNRGLPPQKARGLGPRNLKVSPADPRLMLVENHAGKWGVGGRYRSGNGGEDWEACVLDPSRAFMPSNGREPMFAWSPLDPFRAWSFGGAYLTLSSDGGRTFAWSNNGNNGLACQSPFQFNAFDPDLFLVASQDYNSVVTEDGGQSWEYLNVSGKRWGGFNYGAYALNKDVLIVGDAPSWKGPRTLKVSFNGGRSWKDPGVTGNHTDSACGDPTDPKTAFWDQWRTHDGGRHWVEMKGCQGVYAFDPRGKDGFFGADGVTVTVSRDQGRTWTPVVEAPARITDLAYDAKGKGLFIAAEGLYHYDLRGTSLTDLSRNLPKDNDGNRKVVTVALDPLDAQVVYVGFKGNKYLTDQAVRRSLDGGKTWVSLTKRPGKKAPTQPGR